MTLLLVLFATSVYSDVHVRGYFRKNGTYVQPHYRSNPINDNWSTKGDINPYTGQKGTRSSPYNFQQEQFNTPERVNNKNYYDY